MFVRKVRDLLLVQEEGRKSEGGRERKEENTYRKRERERKYQGRRRRGKKSINP